MSRVIYKKKDKTKKKALKLNLPCAPTCHNQPAWCPCPEWSALSLDLAVITSQYAVLQRYGLCNSHILRGGESEVSVSVEISSVPHTRSFIQWKCDQHHHQSKVQAKRVELTWTKTGVLENLADRALGSGGSLSACVSRLRLVIKKYRRRLFAL